MLRGPDWISTLIYGITVCPAGAKTDSPHQAFDSTEPCRLESLQSSAARHLIERTSAIVPTAALFTNAAPLFNPDCRNWVAVPFKMIRDQRPHLMLSAMTIAELARKMACGKCGGRDVKYRAWRQEDAPGYAKNF
jgi:hypothetical protein